MKLNRHSIGAAMLTKISILAGLVVGWPHAVFAAVEPQSVTLDILKTMDLTQEHLISARIASYTEEENKAKQWQTLGAMFPSLSLDSNQLWLSKDINKAVGKSLGGSIIPDRINTASLTLAQPITPLWPLYLKLQSDFELTRVSQLEKEQAKRNARYYGAELFIKAQKAEQFLTIADASLKLVTKQRSDGEALYRAGKLTSVDVLRLDMALADAKTQLAQARNLRALGLFALCEATGIKEYNNIKLIFANKPMFASLNTELPQRDEMIKKAEAERAEIKSAKARENMVELYKLGNNADYFPTVMAFAKYERDFEKTDLSVPDTAAIFKSIATGQRVSASAMKGTFFSKKDIQDTLTFGLSIKWSIWDWGIRWNKSSELEASIQKAKLAQEQIESGVKIETTQAFLDLEYTKIALETSQANAKFAEEAYKQQNAKFQSGSATVTDIITAERDQTRAQGGLSNAVGDLDLAWINLHKVTGQNLAIANIN